MTNLERVLGTLSAKDIAINIDDWNFNNNCLYASRICCAGCPIEGVCGILNLDEINSWLESECDT